MNSVMSIFLVLQKIIPSLLFLFALFNFSCETTSQNPTVSIITDETPGPPVMHGFAKLTVALAAKNIPFEQVRSMDEAKGDILIAAGLSYGDNAAALRLKDNEIMVPEIEESLTILQSNWYTKPLWVISGFDDRGLMYALLDAADRIGWSNDPASPLSELQEITERPEARDRAISIYTMNRAYWESRFHDETYWERYLDMLAQNRFNTLVVIFGYENGGFLAPCYPYFFNVEGFPDIRMDGMTESDQQRNLATLNRLIRMAHDRGIDFKVGIWDHIYRGGVQRGGIPENGDQDQPLPGGVRGVTEDNLYPYTKAALTQFIRLVPGLNGIQFRMHDESGLKKDEMLTFWTEVFQMIQEIAPDLKLDLRAKGLPDSIIKIALEMGIDFRITTKYWMEQMGMPFHPTHINRENQFDRRHGYADLLRYPQKYKIHWRLWTGGTARILLWGNPEYVRRFVQSTHLYDGDGYEVNEPLATKMEAQPHDAEPFDLLNPAYRYYDYEFERYWHFFQVFGRLGYNPNTSPEIWDREFEHRMGSEAGPLIKEALHRASWILPSIIAACAPYSKFPTTRGWPEKQRFGDLPAYAMAEGSDIQQFASFDEEARLVLEGGETAKVLPSSTSRWFLQTSANIEKLIVEAEKVIGNDQNKEFISTVVDLKILSGLAQYHAYRIPAAIHLRLFEHTHDVSYLDEAIQHEEKAIEAWRAIVHAAADYYTDDLMMGVRYAEWSGMGHRLCGHWKDELSLLESGLADLEKKLQELPTVDSNSNTDRVAISGNVNTMGSFIIDHQAVTTTHADEAITIDVRASAPSGIKWVRLRYRSVNQMEDYKMLPMKVSGEKDLFQAMVPAHDIDPQWDFMYFIELMDNDGDGTIYPDFNRETPYIFVKLDR